MVERYVPPLISGELGQATAKAAADRNFYARGIQSSAVTEIDGQSIDSLVKEFGSPLFVFSERDLRKKARRMRTAFASRYPNTSFAWSVKTNYLNAIIQVFRKEGWIAEVVSDFEYHKVRKLGVPAKEVVFNGPYKPQAALKLAMKEGALIQIDNWDELSHVEELAKDSQGSEFSSACASGWMPVCGRSGPSSGSRSQTARPNAPRPGSSPIPNSDCTHCTATLGPISWRRRPTASLPGSWWRCATGSTPGSGIWSIASISVAAFRRTACCTAWQARPRRSCHRSKPTPTRSLRCSTSCRPASGHCLDLNPAVVWSTRRVIC